MITGEAAQRLRQLTIENWIAGLSRNTLADLCTVSVDITRESIAVAPNELRAALLRVARGEDVGVVWTARSRMAE